MLWLCWVYDGLIELDLYPFVLDLYTRFPSKNPFPAYKSVIFCALFTNLVFENSEGNTILFSTAHNFQTTSPDLTCELFSVEMADTSLVTIKEFENAGKFTCSPEANDANISNLDFLASLNSHFLNTCKNVDSFIPEIGDFVAVKTTIGDCETELWYRAKIMQMFQTPQGSIIRSLLVDGGGTVCTTKTRIRKLPDKFLDYPHQEMTCIFNNLVPVTIGSSADLKMSLKKSNNWDSSATKYIEDLIQGAKTSIKIVDVDEDNIHHVILYVDKVNKQLLNVNENLVYKKYATIKSMDDEILSQQPIQQPAPSVQSAKLKSQSYMTPNLRLEKEKQQKKIELQCNKQAADLLSLINGGSTKQRPSNVLQPSENSGSELSDIDTPVRTPFSNPAMIANKLGQRSTDFLTRGFGMAEEKEDLKQKSVTFSLNVSEKQIKEVHAVQMDEKPDSDITVARNVDSSFLSQALCGGIRNLCKGTNQQPKFLDDDVLVYGKLKRDPFQNINQLNLQLPLKSSLSEMNALNPSSFQKHMWPAVAAFRNVVGIAEIGTSLESKVLSYILPILCNMIGQEGVYNTLGKQNAPFLIICVAGWEEARFVYDICDVLTKYYRKKVNIDIRYGGMTDVAERNIRLLNGCDIFITTVPSLNEVLNQNFLLLDRLCHIIFDNADILVETFTEDIKKFMNNYATILKKTGNTHNKQIIAVSRKWSYGIHSLVNSYLDDPLVIIANKIEGALFAKVPIVPEICNSDDRLDHLINFVETEASDENAIIFTNSATGAEKLHEELKSYSIISSLITDYTTPLDIKDTKLAWNSACAKSKRNVMILSDNAILLANLKNATVVIHYDYPQKKSNFGNRLGCLLNSIRENENKEKPKSLLCQIFITEKNNGFRYCTGLVKIIIRAGQNIPELLKSMASSSYELKEEQKEFSDICPSLKLFGECRYIEDCQERHTVFKEKDLLGLYPSTGFVKIIILDVITASSFWGRIIEHHLPYDPAGSNYDTTVYLKLNMAMQLHYSSAECRKLCTSAEKFDICVINTDDFGFQRVRIEDMVEKENERPKNLLVFGIDCGFTQKVEFSKLFVCADQFVKTSPQAVEVIACCVKPIEKGKSWTGEAVEDIRKKVSGKTMEGRVQLTLQNTIWVDPLVEKKVMCGIKTKTYSIDIGRDLLQLGYADRNKKHVEKLRKLMFDIHGHPIDVVGNKQNLPASMIDHETSYLSDEDYEEVMISSVAHPGLFFVQRVESSEMLRKLDNKINATMSVEKPQDKLVTDIFPVGYLCVAEFSADKKWYRAQILAISEDQFNYDIFFVDHGDREWVGGSKVAAGWPDILTEPFQAIECCFKSISPFDTEWTLEDGDELYDLVAGKLLSAKVLSIAASTYIQDTLSYEIELFDTTCNVTQNINHELVFMGVAKGSLQCLQQMFPHASISQTNKVINNDTDKCPDLCMEIYSEVDDTEKVMKARTLETILLGAPADSDLVLNGSIESLCRIIALTKNMEVQEILLSILSTLVSRNDRCALSVEDSDGIKALVEVLKKTYSENSLIHIIKTIQLSAQDPWSIHVLQFMGYINYLCAILHDYEHSELLISVMEALTQLCKDDENNCTTIRQADGLEELCVLYGQHSDIKVVEKCTDVLVHLLKNSRNKEKVREIGGLQILASVSNKKINEASFKNVLQILKNCIDDNDLNRDYLHRLNAHQDLTKCKTQRKMSIIVKVLFNDLIQKLTPPPTIDYFSQSESVINPSFCKIDDNETDNDKIVETLSPRTLWSQRLNFVTISLPLRGVENEEKAISENKVYFRTVLNNIEYILDIELFAAIHHDQSIVYIKGGEVIFTLRKVNEGEVWPRLLATTEKVAYIGIDFDRWVEDLKSADEQLIPCKDGQILFQPDLPAPPPRTSYVGEVISVEEPGCCSTEPDSSDDDEDDKMVENIGGHSDYFNI